MITKGIVEEILTSYKLKVRAPMLDRMVVSGLAKSTSSLNESIICTLPGCDINLKVGDIVFLAFEDNDYSKPIILGCLYRTVKTDSYCDLILNVLDVNLSAKLPSNTTIGEITPVEISHLHGIKTNIQEQLNYLSDKIDYLFSCKK